MPCLSWPHLIESTSNAGIVRIVPYSDTHMLYVSELGAAPMLQHFPEHHTGAPSLHGCSCCFACSWCSGQCHKVGAVPNFNNMFL